MIRDSIPIAAEESAAHSEPVPDSFSFDNRKEETSIVDLALPLVEHRRLIGRWVICGVVLATVIAFVLPVQYTGISKILPPQQAQSAASAMLGQFSALAGLAGKDLGIKNPADMYVGILKSRTVSDAVVRSCDLQKYYRASSLWDTRIDLEKHSDFESGKDGLITIRFSSRDPKLSAKVANAYVEQLYKANQRLALTEASQRRIFFEQELEAEKNSLADAEVELRQTQESTGLIQPTSQSEATLRAIAQLRAQLTAKEVELRGMSTYATSDNPQVLRIQQEVAGLRSQLQRLQRSAGSDDTVGISASKLPEAGLQYIRKLREVKYHESLFEILAKQFEAAKIDEGKNAPMIQVVDEATVPEKKSGPPRTVIILVSAFLAFFFGSIHAWGRSALREMKRDPQQHASLEALRRAARPRSRVRL